jgi:hypothetical protein
MRRRSALECTPPSTSTPIGKARGGVEHPEHGDRDRQGGDGRQRIPARVLECCDAQRQAAEQRQQRRRAEDRAQVRAVGGDARQQRGPP